MNNHPGVEQVFAWVQKLKTVVQEFAARETKLNQDTQGKLTATEQRRELEEKQIRTEQEARIAEIDATLRAALEAATARHQRRIPAIREAYKASIKDQGRRLEEYEGSRKYKLQMDVMQSKKCRETALLEADKARDAFIKEGEVIDKDLEAGQASARSVLKAHPGTLKPLAEPVVASSATPTVNEHEQRAEALRKLGRARELAKAIGRMPIPALMRLLPLWVVLWLALPVLYWVLPGVGAAPLTWAQIGGIMGGALVLGLILLLISKSQISGAGKEMVASLVAAKKLHQESIAQSHGRHEQTHAQIETEYQARSTTIEQEWSQAMEEATQWRGSIDQDLAEQEVRCLARNDTWLKRRQAELQKQHDEQLSAIEKAVNLGREQAKGSAQSKETRHRSDYREQQQRLESDWKQAMEPLYQEIQAASNQSESTFPGWDNPLRRNWVPPQAFPEAVPFGKLQVDVGALAGKLPSGASLALPGPAQLNLPLHLQFPQRGALLIESDDTGRGSAVSTLNEVMLQLLTSAPPGRVQFTVIDPVGLGENFATVMHLADYAEHVINHKIWTQSDQIDEKLGELNDHMEKVIQMYLRSDYATIAEYNREAGNIAEKYHFLVIADFPQNFSDTGMKRLLSIANSGARCGVFTLIHSNTRLALALAQEAGLAELRKSAVVVTRRGSEWQIAGQPQPGTRLALGTPPPAELATDIVHRVGKASRDSNRVQVPFSHIAPAPDALWSESTTEELRVSIGRTGATKLQYLAIGKGTRQHALLAGKTGSGKSTLLHVVITNLALWCSPDEVEFYLVDFKKGVEFKCYAEHQLPHAKVVAIESDREFGLSVLQRVDQELRRRGELFRQAGVQDIPGYKRNGGKEPMPRTMLIVDEFQELFTEDDKVSQNASVLLDRIVRQGRAFGIHVLLGSQTLGGAYTVARTTLGQMVIRIALQCNEADSYLIMDENNAAPRLLSRPGEGIYNDAAGSSEGNSPFQVVWLGDEERDRCLERVREKAAQFPGRFPKPFVFEGDAPAHVEENLILKGLRGRIPDQRPAAARIWLGAPNAIKGPTEVVFQRQSGNHLMMVGQREDALLSIMIVAMVSLASQYPPGTLRLVVVNAAAPESPEQEWLERIQKGIGHPVKLVSPSGLAEAFGELDQELAHRTGGESESTSPSIFVFILGLQKFKKLKAEDEFSYSSSSDSGGEQPVNPATVLGKLIPEGSSVGIHLLISLDTYNNMGRFLSRKAISEFEMRVLFQMSANDSASLIDSPKASTLGLHKAIFYHEKEGSMEVFRPYAMPGSDFVPGQSR